LELKNPCIAASVFVGPAPASQVPPVVSVLVVTMESVWIQMQEMVLVTTASVAGF